MAYQNKTIHNPLTGQEIRFIQTAKDTNGALLDMESTYQPHSTEPPLHYHPAQAEDFKVLSGTMTVRLDGQTRILQTGDTLHIPANTTHSMWNHSDAPAVLQWQVRPALNTEHLLETGMGLAADGKTNERGQPKFLQAVLTANKFSGVYRISKPPYLVQKILFGLLTPAAYLLGYRPVYQKYLD